MRKTTALAIQYLKHTRMHTHTHTHTVPDGGGEMGDELKEQVMVTEDGTSVTQNFNSCEKCEKRRVLRLPWKEERAAQCLT